MRDRALLLAAICISLRTERCGGAIFELRCALLSLRLPRHAAATAQPEIGTLLVEAALARALTISHEGRGCLGMTACYVTSKQILAIQASIRALHCTVFVPTWPMSRTSTLAFGPIGSANGTGHL